MTTSVSDEIVREVKAVENLVFFHKILRLHQTLVVNATPFHLDHLQNLVLLQLSEDLGKTESIKQIARKI
jgi:hypothetical protein